MFGKLWRKKKEREEGREEGKKEGKICILKRKFLEGRIDMLVFSWTFHT